MLHFVWPDPGANPPRLGFGKAINVRIQPLKKNVRIAVGSFGEFSRQICRNLATGRCANNGIEQREPTEVPAKRAGSKKHRKESFQCAECHCSCSRATQDPSLTPSATNAERTIFHTMDIIASAPNLGRETQLEDRWTTNELARHVLLAAKKRALAHARALIGR